MPLLTCEGLVAPRQNLHVSTKQQVERVPPAFALFSCVTLFEFAPLRRFGVALWPFKR